MDESGGAGEVRSQHITNAKRSIMGRRNISSWWHRIQTWVPYPVVDWPLEETMIFIKNMKRKTVMQVLLVFRMKAVLLKNKIRV